MKRLLILISALCLFFIDVHPQSYTVETVPNDRLTNARDYVSNPDGIISQQAEQTINDLLASSEEYATAEVAVVLLKSIGNDDIDDFGTRLFTHWGIGKDKKDNGLLFLLVYDQKKMIFRSGYGLEGVLPDVILSRIIRNDISPSLRKGNFDAGIIAGILKVCDYLKNPETVQEIRQQEEERKIANHRTFIYGYLSVCVIAFLLFFIALIYVLRSNKTNYKKYLNINNWKPIVIFFSILFIPVMLIFVIFYFVMLRRLRNKPIACTHCGNKMRKLSESEEDAYLKPVQQVEENIQSINYDVWYCDACHATEVLPYNKMSRYSSCPHCGARAYYLSDDRTIRRATSLHSGEGQKTYACKNCGQKDFKKYIIPIIVATAASSGRGSSWGGGGGGSWGGGATGGGGARGGW